MESRDSFAMRKLCFLDASPFLQPGCGKRHIHGQGVAKNFMEEVLVAVLREDDLTVSGRRVSKMNCGKCTEAVVLASNQDRVLSRVVADPIGPRGKHLAANGEVE